ncbi:AfsR/SARP family transcriptional regulator [Jidongwangia harbinensis]|uniref:AfsR/SARP family transcriptional regulator n=1 Tax=Jidongwangia harbinensis TaxID=2878561 RepID=UPI001CD9B19A|nr:AfsR/SARP family transcriptional regulator [Jidongwangia harbinensis]MCA2214090.1 AfsR/SARP family transcriptional regulator [Jidongwangia harbinensis]
MPTDTVRYSVLGPIRAWRAGAEIDLGSPQQRTLLAVLLLHEGAVVESGALLRAIWGENRPSTAATVARTYVSRLRQVLAEPRLVPGARIRSAGGGYALAVPEDALDVTRFRRYAARGAEASGRGDFAGAATHLSAALALRHGPPLAGAAGPYAEAQRSRLHELIRTTELDLLTAELAMGSHRAILADLAAKVAEHPLWEPLHELFMTALYRSGRQADALAHYQWARRRLVDELGVEPGTRLRELHRRILLGHPAVDAVAADTNRHINSDTALRTRTADLSWNTQVAVGRGFSPTAAWWAR